MNTRLEMPFLSEPNNSIRVGEVDQRPLVVSCAFERQAPQIVRLAIGRRAPDEFVGDLDRLRIVGQPQIVSIDRCRAVTGAPQFMTNL
jgi:hypothetical protein